MPQTKLMIPGPVDIPETIREAMGVASMPHYGQDWICLFDETKAMLQRVFGTQHDLYIMAGPGTMALEAALGSALEPGDAVLVPSNGFFADRVISLVEGLGLVPVRVPVPLGKPILPEVVETALAAHPEVKALAMVHHETSTCVLNPLESIAAVARAHGVLIVVDAVSSMGGVPLPVDKWDIDLCVTVANKVLETPPALSLLSISPRAWERIEARKAPRGWYMDLRTWRWYAQNWGDWHPTPVTMPTSNLYALNRSLKLLLSDGEDGLQRRYAEYGKAATAVRRGLEAVGFPMLVEDAFACPLTTAFCPRPGIDPADLQKALLKDAGVMISGGIGDLKGKILRVGHIGLAREYDYVVAFLLGVENYVRQQGVDIPVGQSLVAVKAMRQ